MDFIWIKNPFLKKKTKFIRIIDPYESYGLDIKEFSCLLQGKEDCE